MRFRLRTLPPPPWQLVVGLVFACSAVAGYLYGGEFWQWFVGSSRTSSGGRPMVRYKLRTLPPPPWQLIVAAGIIGVIATMVFWAYFDEYMAWMNS